VVSAAFASAFDAHIAHASLGGAAQSAVTQAKHLALGVPDVHGLPAATASVLTHAASAASVHGFRLGVAIAAALVALGGVAGTIGVRNPSRDVSAEECPGGQLVGASRHLTRPGRSVAAEPAQPTGSRA
jgi:hypothetical protein